MLGEINLPTFWVVSIMRIFRWLFRFSIFGTEVDMVSILNILHGLGVK